MLGHWRRQQGSQLGASSMGISAARNFALGRNSARVTANHFPLQHRRRRLNRAAKQVDWPPPPFVSRFTFLALDPWTSRSCSRQRTWSPPARGQGLQHEAPSRKRPQPIELFPRPPSAQVTRENVKMQSVFLAAALDRWLVAVSITGQKPYLHSQPAPDPLVCLGATECGQEKRRRQLAAHLPLL